MYADIPFPPRIALASQRRPIFETNIVRVGGGRESRNEQRSLPERMFDISFAVRTAADYEAVEQHFHSVRGALHTFPFRDALDYRVEARNGVLLDDGDSPTTDYQLAKRYGLSGHTYDRPITRPRSGTVAIFRLRSGNTADITTSSTIDLATGRVSFTGGTVQGGDVLSWAGQFWVPCRYESDELPGAIVGKNPGAVGQLLVQCESIMLREDIEWEGSA